VREVVGAGRPSVFVRLLATDEGRRLQRITRTGTNPVRMCRAIVVSMRPGPDRPRHHLVAAGQRGRGAGCDPPVQRAAVNGTDHRSHDEQNAAIAAYVRRHSARARPETNFAVGSPTLTRTSCPVEAA